MQFLIVFIMTLPLQILFLIYFYLNKKKIKNRLVHILAYTSTTLSFLLILFFVLALLLGNNQPYLGWDIRGEVVHDVPNSNSQIKIREYSHLHTFHSKVFYDEYDIGTIVSERFNFTSGDYQIEFLDDGVVVFYYSYKADEDFTETYFEYPLLDFLGN